MFPNGGQGGRRTHALHRMASSRRPLLARLHAELAAFAVSTPKLPFIRLQSLEPDAVRHVQQLARSMGLMFHQSERARLEQRCTIQKPEAYSYDTANAALLEACDTFGAGPLAQLFTEPMSCGRAVHPGSAAASITSLVRTCAATGRLEDMVDALETGTAYESDAPLAGNAVAYNRAIGAAMKALTHADRAADAVELYEQAVGIHGLSPNGIVVMRLCIAARKAGRSSAERAIALVHDLLATGAISLNAQGTDAYLHCCATANAARAALEMFVRGLDEYAAGEMVDARADERQLIRLASVLKACAQEGNARLARDAARAATSRGLNLNGDCTRTLITALSRGGDCSRAVHVFRRHMRQHAVPVAPASLSDLPLDVAATDSIAIHVETDEAAAWEAIAEHHRHAERFWLPAAEEVEAAAAVAARVVHREREGRARRGKVVGDGGTTREQGRLQPTELSATLNCALASTGHNIDLVFALLREAGACGVAPDAFGLTAAISAVAEPLSVAARDGVAERGAEGQTSTLRFMGEGADAALAGGRDVDGAHAAAALVLWGLELGVEPDVYMVQTIERALSPVDGLAAQVLGVLTAAEVPIAVQAKRDFGRASRIVDDGGSARAEAHELLRGDLLSTRRPEKPRKPTAQGRASEQEFGALLREATQEYSAALEEAQAESHASSLASGMVSHISVLKDVSPVRRYGKPSTWRLLPALLGDSAEPPASPDAPASTDTAQAGASPGDVGASSSSTAEAVEAVAAATAQHEQQDSPRRGSPVGATVARLLKAAGLIS